MQRLSYIVVLFLFSLMAGVVSASEGDWSLGESVVNDECLCEKCWHLAKPLPRHKQSFFQLWESESAWIGTDSAFELTEVNTLLRMAIPLDSSQQSFLALQPGLRTFFLNGPTITDVPSTVYDAQLSIMWRKTFSDRWQTNVWLQPKIRSDFVESQDNFFFSGGGFAKYAWKPGLVDVYMGALYLDRDDISFLPAFGMIYTPTPSSRYEVVLPRPKFAHRLSRTEDCETWAYLGGQLGGGSFAVRRDGGMADKMTLRDFRIYLGWEQVSHGGSGLFAELGYVFNRTIEYAKFDEEYEFDDSLMLRMGWRM